jgi:hypothetical protein
MMAAPRTAVVVSFPCSQCKNTKVTVTHRSFGIAVLFCRECEHAWSVDPRPHATLMAVPVSQMSRWWQWE